MLPRLSAAVVINCLNRQPWVSCSGCDIVSACPHSSLYHVSTPASQLHLQPTLLDTALCCQREHLLLGGVLSQMTVHSCSTAHPRHFSAIPRWILYRDPRRFFPSPCTEVRPWQNFSDNVSAPRDRGGHYELGGFWWIHRECGSDRICSPCGSTKVPITSSPR